MVGAEKQPMDPEPTRSTSPFGMRAVSRKGETKRDILAVQAPASRSSRSHEEKLDD
jgi:hypothetical protein